MKFDLWIVVVVCIGRIMGEEESSAKDDDADDETAKSTSVITADDTSSLSFHPPHNTIYFTPNGPFSQQDYHPVQISPCPPMPMIRYSSPSNLWYPHQQQQQHSYPPE